MSKYIRCQQRSFIATYSILSCRGAFQWNDFMHWTMERGPVVFYLGSVSSSGGAKPGTQASPPSPPVLSVQLHAGKVSKKPSTPSLNCPLFWAQLETPLKLNPFPTQIPRFVHESQYLDAPSANLLHSSVQVLNFKESRSWWCPPLEEKKLSILDSYDPSWGQEIFKNDRQP